MLRFQRTYFVLALLLFIVEVLIAIYVNDRFVRPYGGDFLVVILIYCFLMAFRNTSVKAAASFVLLFAYVVEVLQYFKFVKYFGLKDSKLANVVLGNSFAWSDMLAYTLGILLVLFIEQLFIKRSRRKNHNKLVSQ